MSISPTFFEQLLNRYSCGKKLKKNSKCTVSTKQLQAKLWYEKAARKMLLILTSASKTFVRKSRTYNVGEIDLRISTSSLDVLHFADYDKDVKALQNSMTLFLLQSLKGAGVNIIKEVKSLTKS